MPAPTLGIVIPTKNSMKYLPGHMENLATWIDLAQQVVVVDSFSTDGTVDFIKQNLRHPNILFVQHPPGLYASWNHGIQQLKTEYCFISTVGDFITRAGMEHFVEAAVRFQCDVLVSCPDFINDAGQPCTNAEWPMEDIVKTLQLKESCKLSPALVVTSALMHNGGAITGSCASDLFRTAVLQQDPFPLEFGTAGDGAWSLRNAARLKWAVSVEKVTTFRCHLPTASAEEIKTGRHGIQCPDIIPDMIDAWLKAKPSKFHRRIVDRIKRLPNLPAEIEQAQQKYRRYQKRLWPWILRPAAWRARAHRNRLRQELAEGRPGIFRAAQNHAG